MSKICLIHQPCGIGDIFYSIGIARYYQKLGYRIIWPVIKELIYLKEYVFDIEFYSEEENFPKKEYYTLNNSEIINTNDFIYLPIHKSTNITKGLTMPSKYSVSNVPNTWREDFTWNRNIEKENKLYEILGLKENDHYVFINQNFITPPRTIRFPMNVDINNNKTVFMEYIKGYNVLDWAKVIEKASGIITVDTCIQYMIDKLNMKSEFYYCYLRNGNDTFREIKNLFSTNWVFLDKDNTIYN
jgi:hypothetical protein